MYFDKASIQNNFSKQCNNYDNNAKVQKQTAEKLCDFLVQQKIPITNPTINSQLKILDLGSGTSFITKKLFSQNYQGQIYELDISPAMLNQFQSNNPNHFKICGDIENFNLEPHSFDIIISSFSLQWLDNFQPIFCNIKKHLKQNGIFAFAIPDDKSFKNLQNLPFRILKMPNHQDVLDALKANNFKEKFYLHETINEAYENVIDAVKSFKKIGANYINVNQKFDNLRNKNKAPNDLKNFIQVRKFYLKNFANKLEFYENGFKLDWSISYYIFSI